jgi:hypothetical protein
MQVRYRTVQVPGAGKLQVPTHVFRVDRGSHGWSVRVIVAGERNYQFFGDAEYKGPKGSLAAADDYAAKHRPKIRTGARLNTGVGIQLVRLAKKDRPLGDHYVVIPKLVKGVAAHRIYIGNDHTITESRYNAAMKDAKIIRQRFVDEHMAMLTERARQEDLAAKRAKKAK